MDRSVAVRAALATDSDVVLSVRGLTKSFGRLVAVQDVSFDVQPGEVFGLAGPNGAGKSTLFNSISGVPFKPDGGSVLLNGSDIAGMRGWRIARAGLARTWQTEAVFDDLSVLENVALCGSRSALGRTRNRQVLDARDALHTVGLQDESAKPGALSLVGRKRLMIATAIVSQPDVLLLDEPAAGLEPPDQDDLINLLREINGRGIAIVLVEHVLRVLRAVCSRMAVLDAGKIVVSGEPDTVLADPRVVEAYLGPGGAR